jgi:hypothetical protein
MEFSKSYLSYTDDFGIVGSIFRICVLILFSLRYEFDGTKGFKLTFRRLSILFALGIILPALIIWNHVGFYLDSKFFPNWENMKVEEPLFLIGNARSGTTWLHRILTESNTEMFTTFRTWEIIFAVPITWKYLFYTLYKIDENFCFGLSFYCIMYIENKLFHNNQTVSTSTSSLHPIGLMEAEEDEWLMMHIGLAQLLFFFFPTMTIDGNALILFDYHPDMLLDMHELLEATLQSTTIPTDLFHQFQRKSLQYNRKWNLPIVYRMKIFQYYQQCIQRHIYFYDFLLRQSSHNKSISSSSSSTSLLPLIFVSKNPAFTLRIPTIQRIFPDARILCLIRNPIQSIPSMISYISHVWQCFASPMELYPKAELLLGFCEAHYLFPMMFLSSHTLNNNNNNCKGGFVSYQHLATHLVETVLSILIEYYPHYLHPLSSYSTSSSATANSTNIDDTMNVSISSTSSRISLENMKRLLYQEQLRTSKSSPSSTILLIVLIIIIICDSYYYHRKFSIESLL